MKEWSAEQRTPRDRKSGSRLVGIRGQMNFGGASAAASDSAAAALIRLFRS